MESFFGRTYIGVVEDNNDPKRLGRCKIRVPHTYDVLPLEQLPWSFPYIDIDGKTFKIPPIGKIVNVIFYNGNIYSPYYIYSDKYNLNLQDKLETMTEDEYKNFIALLFDHRTRVYAEKEGFTIDYLVNKVKIDKSSINLELKDNDGKLNLGTASADQPAVLGNHFIMEWFMDFMKILLKPTTLTGNMGAPVLKPELDAHIQKFLTNPKQFISSNVFIVDNDKVDKLERDCITTEVEHDDTTFFTPDEIVDGGGVNVEKTKVISETAQTSITTNQQNSREEIKNAVPTISMSDELSKSSLNDLGISKSLIPAGIDLSQISIKNMIDTSKINLSTFDLSTITPDYLNLDYLTKIGFSALTIVGLTSLIIDKIKEINNNTKNKRESYNSSNTSGSDTTTYNGVDQYLKKRKDSKKNTANSDYSVQKRDRSDILNSSKSISTKISSIVYKNNPNYGKYYNGM